MERYLKTIGILFGNVVMGLTKIYKEVGKNVSKSEQSGDLNDQNVDDSCFDSRDDDDGIMGLIPEHLSDSSAEAEKRGIKGEYKSKRDANSRTKPCGRGKRTR